MIFFTVRQVPELARSTAPGWADIGDRCHDHSAILLVDLTTPSRLCTVSPLTSRSFEVPDEVVRPCRHREDWSSSFARVALFALSISVRMRSRATSALRGGPAHVIEESEHETANQAEQEEGREAATCGASPPACRATSSLRRFRRQQREERGEEHRRPAAPGPACWGICRA